MVKDEKKRQEKNHLKAQKILKLLKKQLKSQVLAEKKKIIQKEKAQK